MTGFLATGGGTFFADDGVDESGADFFTGSDAGVVVVAEGGGVGVFLELLSSGGGSVFEDEDFSSEGLVEELRCKMKDIKKSSLNAILKTVDRIMHAVILNDKAFKTTSTSYTIIPIILLTFWECCLTIEQSAKQPATQKTRSQTTCQTISHFNGQTIKQSVKKPTNLLNNQPVYKPNNQPILYQLNRPINKLNNQLIDQ